MEFIDGRYRVIRILGKGGCGAVYVCNDTTLGKEVAVKVMLDGCEDVSDIKRFQKEAHALSLCHHPGIIQIRAFGMCNERSPYYVMDFVDGKSMSAIIAADGPLAPGRFSRIFTQVLEALQHAHDAGLVHRDIKPSNIMVSGEGDDERVYLIDFGLIRNLQSGTRITSTNAVLGTPFYMSPEQCTNGAIDQRSDLYALGCTMYECATGAPPFTGETLEVLMAHLNEQPSQMPKEIAGLLQGCLAKDPDQRSIDAVTVRADLQELHLNQYPKFTLTDNSSSSLKSAAKKSRRAGTTPLAVLCCVIVPLAMVGWWLANQPREPNSDGSPKPISVPAAYEDIRAKVDELHKQAQKLHNQNKADLEKSVKLERDALALLNTTENTQDSQRWKQKCLLMMLHSQNALKVSPSEMMVPLKEGLVLADRLSDQVAARDFYLIQAQVYDRMNKPIETRAAFEASCSLARKCKQSPFDPVGKPFVAYSNWLRDRNEAPKERIDLLIMAIRRYQDTLEHNVDFHRWLLDEPFDCLLRERPDKTDRKTILELYHLADTGLEQADLLKDPREIINMQCRAARLIALAGDNAEAKANFFKIIAESEKREHHPQVCTAAAIHHMLHEVQISKPERLKYAKLALRMCETTDPIEDHALVSARIRAADEYCRVNNYAQASKYYGAAADLAEKRLGRRQPTAGEPSIEIDYHNAISCRLRAAECQQLLGNTKQAAAIITEADRLMKVVDADPVLANAALLKVTRNSLKLYKASQPTH